MLGIQPNLVWERDEGLNTSAANLSKIVLTICLFVCLFVCFVVVVFAPVELPDEVFLANCLSSASNLIIK